MRFDRYRSLYALTAGQRLRFSGAILALWGTVALGFGLPLALLRPLDRLGRGESVPLGELLTAAALAVALTAGSGALAYVRGRWAAEASERIVQRLRDTLHAHLHRLPLAWHERAETGDLVQRCTSDVETVRVFLAVQVTEIGRTVLLLTVAVPLLFWLDASLAWISLCLLPVIFAAALVFFRRVQGRFLAVDQAESRLTSVLQENLSGVRVVRAFGREQHEIERFGAANEEFRRESHRLLQLLSSFWSASDLLCLVQSGLVLVVGASRVHSGELSVGGLFAFIAYVGMVLWPVRHLGRVLTDAGKALVAMDRLREVLDAPPQTEPPLPAGLPPRLRGAVEFTDVHFAHSDGTVALRGLSLRLEPGTSLALIGPPGAGKSTLVRLLLRFDDPSAGTIALDGHDLRTLPRSYVRAQVAAALQEPYLYSRTINENLRFAAPSRSAEELREAAREASIATSIESFELAYETRVGERGVNLSGGQRQRISLARTLLVDAPVLVLDDTVSAVDTHTEREILAALAARRGRVTTLLIAHRLSTVRAADQIAVLDQGRVVQLGSHEQLSQVEGPYRRLWRIQTDQDRELVADLAPGVSQP